MSLADEISRKTPSEVLVLPMDFAKKCATGETLSGVSSVAFSPTGSLTLVSSAYSGTVEQSTVSGGISSFMATATATDDLFTATAHGLSDGDRVKLAEITSCDFPGGFVKETRTDKSLYYVVSSTANTFQLACHSGGDAVSITSDGECTVFVEYLVTVTVTTSASQTLVGKGRLQVRS